MMWAQSWVWFAAALLLVIFEMFVPAYVFLGFAIGAGMTGVGLWLAGPESAFATSLPLLLVVFAVLSLIAWIVLRRVIGIRKGQIKIIDKDIND
jgi:membrane protein implicated in regulation of membrane protease activity